MEIILASTSKYRRALLEGIGLNPICKPPLCDEEDISTDSDTAKEVARKRGRLKAASLMENYPKDIIVGSDQLVHFENEILGKPNSHENACSQIKKMSGKTHELVTSFTCFLDGEEVTHTNVTRLEMKNLSDESINNYVLLDKPYDCAGSYKIEQHGLWLFEKIETEDHSAIQGLPLIAFIKIIEKLGYSKL